MHYFYLIKLMIKLKILLIIYIFISINKLIPLSKNINHINKYKILKLSNKLGKSNMICVKADLLPALISNLLMVIYNFLK